MSGRLFLVLAFAVTCSLRADLSLAQTLLLPQNAAFTPSNSSNGPVTVSGNTTGSLGNLCSSQAGILTALQGAASNSDRAGLNLAIPAGLTDATSLQQVAQVIANLKLSYHITNILHVCDGLHVLCIRLTCTRCSYGVGLPHGICSLLPVRLNIRLVVTADCVALHHHIPVAFHCQVAGSQQRKWHCHQHLLRQERPFVKLQRHRHCYPKSRYFVQPGLLRLVTGTPLQHFAHSKPWVKTAWMCCADSQQPESLRCALLSVNSWRAYV